MNFISVDELQTKIENDPRIIEDNTGYFDDVILISDVLDIIDECKTYERKETCTAEWEKVANNIEMERVTRVGIHLKCSKCENIVFATRNKGNYKIDNYCSHCGARMSEKVGGDNGN